MSPEVCFSSSLALQTTCPALLRTSGQWHSKTGVKMEFIKLRSHMAQRQIMHLHASGYGTVDVLVAQIALNKTHTGMVFLQYAYACAL